MKFTNRTILTIAILSLCICFQSCSKDSDKNDDTSDDETNFIACENGFADIYPCNGYDLMANIPLSTFGAASGSDIWGWTDSTTGHEYALFATDINVSFIDITEPTNPIYLGNVTTETFPNAWRDVKIYSNYAFIVGDNVGEHGMQVFDLTRLRNVTSPIRFTPDTVYTGVDSCHNVIINESEGYAYLVGCNTFGGGPNFIDISDPLNPVDASGYSGGGYSHDAQVVTYNGPDTEHLGKEIYIGSNEDEIVILDVTDKSNIIELSSLSYTQLGYTHQGWFTEDMTYFILGDELDEQGFGFNSRTLIFNFSDLDNPVLSSTYFGETAAIDHNGYVKNDLYYLANYTAGLRVLDITNISSSTNAMTEIAYFDTYPENNGASYNGVWSVYPYFESGNIIISDINRGLFIVRESGT